MTAQPAAHSRRENGVALTGEGTALVRRGDTLFDGARTNGLSAIPAADLATTLSTLAALNAALEHPSAT